MIAPEQMAVPVSPPDDRARLARYLTRPLQEGVLAQGSLLALTTGHVLAAPGKLLRPQLVLDACRAAGGDPERVFPAAAGTEYGHIASLVHDDIIDGDSMRRGQQTVHARYSIPAAILTGDLLIFQTFLSYTLCHERGVGAEQVLAAIRVLACTCMEMCEGQAMEAGMAGRLETTEAAYLEMIRLKTAGVWRAAAEIGACLAGAGDDVLGALRAYGENIGLAFQVVDDLLCYAGSPDRLGKPTRSDLRNGRVTLPIILALRDADPALYGRIADLFAQAPGGVERRHAELARILAATGALEHTRCTAARLVSSAKDQLDSLAPSPARQRLWTLADLVLSRDH